MLDTVVGILGKSNGAPMLLTYERTKRDGDFLRSVSQFPVGTAAATGVMILPALE